MCMEQKPRTPENLKIFIPSNDIKDKFGWIDKILSDSTKLELNFLEYKTENNLSKEDYFEQICTKGLKERYGDNISKEILERYEKEKSFFIKTNFVDIFLHYYDIVQIAKNNNIMIGTGNGTFVSSLICYILGITNVDPIKYNLVFERMFFINPDIELKIGEEKSDLLVDYIMKKYRNEHVGIAFQPSYSDSIDNERLFKTIFVVTEKPIKEYVHIEKIVPDTYLAIEPYEKFEKSNCLKFKFHFMKVLDRIQQSGIDVNSIPLNDKRVFSLFQNPQINKIYSLCNINKIEIDCLKRLKPQNINELAAYLSLTRPLPLEEGMFDDYIEAKNSQIKNKYTELIEPILEETYGEIIYQEQIIQILNVIGEFSLSDSEMLRRCLAKKNDSKMMLNNEKTFIQNAISKGIEYAKAQDLWNKMYKVSACCFMKSHALSISLLAYYDAYIKVQKCDKVLINKELNYENCENIIKTGFSELDNLTGGLNGGELIVIAGRPSMGKSAFAQNLALNISQIKEKNVVVFSLEMPKNIIVKRFLAIKGNIKLKDFDSSKTFTPKSENCCETMKKLAEEKILIDDNSLISLDYIRKKCKLLTENNTKPDILIIDYLQLIKTDKKGDNRNYEIADITKDLKNLARELNIPIILLSQLSRAVDTRENKRPLLCDLRNSPSIEENADKVLFIYRDDYYNKNSNIGETEIIIAKNRNGETGTVKIHFDKETLKFTSIEDIKKILKELSEEELNLLEYFNQDESYKTIKEKYGITLYTNDPRVMNLYDKFDVMDRGELIKKYRLCLNNA